MAESSARPASITVRYFAAARAAAGVDEETIAVAVPATVAGVLEDAVDRHGSALALVLSRCSFLLNETSVRSTDAAVTPGDVVDVLPPFAGG